jgi:hypothetical protein
MVGIAMTRLLQLHIGNQPAGFAGAAARVLSGPGTLDFLTSAR